MENFLDIICDPSASNTHFSEVENLFFEKVCIKSTGQIILRDELEACKNEGEIISLLRPKYKWLPLEKYSSFEKCSTLSSRIRERANEVYKSGDFNNALKGYNLSITFAPAKSLELGLAYANRSALLVHLQRYNEALQDISHALENNFPENLRQKLEQRRSRCLQGRDEKEDFSKKTDQVLRAYFEENFFSIRRPSAVIPRAECFVKIDFREDRGRRLVASEDVPAGNVILIDTPFVSVINGLLAWDLQHCHYCSRPIVAGVPCDSCTFTIYCNEDCRDKACESGHKYEHKYLSYLQPLASKTAKVIGHRHLQALRILGILGPQKLFEVFKQFQTSGKIESALPSASSYLQIFTLISHGLHLPPEDKLRDAFMSLLLTSLLVEKSNFFATLTINRKDELLFENFLASVILRHLWSIKYNAISVSELKKDEGTNNGADVSVPVAAAVYPTISLCNHSCDPNVVPVKKFRMLESALITLKDVKAGEEFCITYLPLFTRMKTDERRSLMKGNYNFFCSCPACVGNWSPESVIAVDDVEAALLKTKCEDCQKLSNSSVCEKCVRKYLEMVSQLDVYEKELYKADDLLKSGKLKKCIETLKPCLSFFSTRFSPCYALSQVAQDLFKRALVEIVNVSEKV